MVFLLYHYHVLHLARHEEETDLLQRQIQELKKIVELQADKSKEEDASILSKLGGLHSTIDHHNKMLPELEEALSRHSVEQQQQQQQHEQQHEQLLQQQEKEKSRPEGAETLNLLQSTYTTLTDKIASLEKMIGVLKQQDLDHIGHHEKFVNPLLAGHDANGLTSSGGSDNSKAAQIVPLSNPGGPGGEIVALSPPKEETNLRGGDKSSSSAAAVVASLPTAHPLGSDTVLLIIASANRPDYLQRTLAAVVQYYPYSSSSSVSVVVSEDGNNPKVADVVRAAKEELIRKSPSSIWSKQHISFNHIHHPASPDLQNRNGYYKLSSHFKWALTEAFSGEAVVPKLDVPVGRVIILEEDLEIAPDFFEFFGAMAPLVDSDPTLLCASAWNDNGQGQLVKDSKALFRSDFFPGLGWMMPRRIWEELQSKWPAAYWDDWLREPPQRKGRHTIRPEVCRTYHFGKIGVSNSQYSNYLDTIKLNDQFVKFSELDLTYLRSDVWDSQILKQVKEAVQVSPHEFDESISKSALDKPSTVRISYHGFEGDRDSFDAIARWSGAMNNVKANVPRTAYKGIVSIWKDGVRMFLVPDDLIARL